MGTTIRRQPVKFDIPRSPEYKFLNITNFRGLDISSNPFELSPNTASDCLNVYVDETNTLTTRPRLEKKSFVNAEGISVLPLQGTHIGTYNLHNGYLLHYVKDGAGTMSTLIDGQLTVVSGIIPTRKCQYFEQGSKIYLLDGERYMVISDDKLSDVEGYVPTTQIIDLKGEVHPVETLNALSSKYNVLHYWDGLSKLPTKDGNVVDVKNDYYNENDFANQFIPVQCYSDYTAFGYYAGTTKLIFAKFEPLKEPEYIDLNFTYSSYLVFMSETKGFWSFSGHALTRYVVDGATLTSASVTIDTSYNITHCTTSPDGKHAIVYVYEGTGSSSYYHIYFSSVSLTYKYFTPPKVEGSSYTLGSYTMSNDHLFWMGCDKDQTKLTVFYAQLSATLSFGAFDEIPQYFSVGGLCTTADGTLLLIYSYRNYLNLPMTIVTYENLNPDTKLIQTPILPYGDPKLSADKIVYGGGWNSYQNFYGKTWYCPDYKNISDYEILDIGDHMIDIDKYNTSTTKDYASFIFKNKYVVVYTKYGSTSKSKYFIYTASKEPLLKYTKELTDTEKTDGWADHNQQITRANLHTRFDNNYWLATSNRYYRSQNNDPTYFPITEYNDLGDSNEKITGFNLANDTTLIAYKRNRVYLIQPFTSSLDTPEYAITESKNTVGNTAVNAPIVTTLTEIPLQINYDGIYGLSQLANVSSTERIADLMSEPINERWLNISDKLIDGIQTLNRLYWTYIIIPDNQETRTMIYLLDNRTNSWYYWELPIVVADSFVKNNMTEFVDTLGNIYYLTTTDIVDKNYSDETVTKYYDCGNRLIHWYWQSQILPMGTMNYSKRLVNTTFILTDTDDSDGYGLQYNFKVFRKLASSTPEKEISDKLTLVRSTTKKTNISKFGFIQMRISNLTTDSRGYEAYENNKLRLVGLGLKYVLLEGLMR